MQRRPPLTGFGRLTLAGFVGLLAATGWKVLFLGGLVAPAIASGLLFLATTAGLVVFRSRWMSVAAAAVAGFAVVGALQSQAVRDMLTTPSRVGDFASTLLLLLAGATGAVGGIATTVQRSRTPRATATSP
jgi:hypothetical protein